MSITYLAAALSPMGSIKTNDSVFTLIIHHKKELKQAKRKIVVLNQTFGIINDSTNQIEIVAV